MTSRSFTFQLPKAQFETALFQTLSLQIAMADIIGEITQSLPPDKLLHWFGTTHLVLKRLSHKPLPQRLFLLMGQESQGRLTYSGPQTIQ